MSQFDEPHRDIAARILDSVEFFGSAQIGASYQQLLAAIPGWSNVPAQRVGKWRFCAWSQSAGESGDSMLHNFRLTNNLSGAAHRELFISRSEIVQARLGPDDTLVFVNDFIGSGSEVCDAWRDSLEELTAGIGRIFLVVAAAYRSGLDRVSAETSIKVAYAHELTETDNIFSQACGHFTGAEKDALLTYCEKADKRQPRGFGECGLVVVFQHRCPNNSIPVLHAERKRWSPLFPRYD